MTKILGIGVIAFLLFILQQKVYQKLWRKSLTVSVDFALDSIFQGESCNLVEAIENRKRLPLSMLKVKFQTDRSLVFTDTEGSRVTDQFYRNDVFQVGGGEKITRTLTFTGMKRGYYKINGIDLVAADLFMTVEMTDSMKTERYLYVYPRPFESREFFRSLQQLNGEVLTRRHLLEDPFEYRGIREYQPYDDIRGVNWKATARTGELKVNQKNYTALQTIRIFVNVEDKGILKKEEAVEASFCIAAGIARFFLAQGVRVALYGNGRDVMSNDTVHIEASAGSGQMESIFRALARVDLKKEEADFKELFSYRLLHEASGTMTFFVAPNAYEDFTGLVEQYLELDRDCIWFYPTLDKEEPVLKERVKGHVRFITLRN